MLNDAGKSSVVLDREVENEKSREPSGPRIRCQLCGWSPPIVFLTAGTSGTDSRLELHRNSLHVR